ncbi:MAG: IS3 family transposase [Lentisphaerae bacterium]|nr:IS3 family transposase [bacterium]MCP4099978.1 IS3 family transposase [Lentisphaerota bacterium]
MELKKRLAKRQYLESDANLRLIRHTHELKAEHPFWGYRRIWAYLRYRRKFKINGKRIYRLMRENKFLAPNKMKRT